MPLASVLRIGAPPLVSVSGKIAVGVPLEPLELLLEEPVAVVLPLEDPAGVDVVPEPDDVEAAGEVALELPEAPRCC